MTTITQTIAPKAHDWITIQCNYPLSKDITIYSATQPHADFIISSGYVVAIWKCKSIRKPKTTQNEPA